MGAKSTTETDVQQILGMSGHITAFYCYQGKAAGADRIYTFRLNGSSTSLTCTVPTGLWQGVTTGASIAIAPGDLIDVLLPGAGEAQPISFSLTVGP
ncbi:MAG: hypothetical protein ACRDS0_37350 [Pseudonocardiaceae bacterium]